jgi:hypothetical protein
MTLGVFVQSSRFIPHYAHIVRPLTELTRSDKGKPVPFTWTPERQQSYDHIRNLLWDGIHLPPPTTAYPSIVAATLPTMASPTASTNSVISLRDHNSPSRPTPRPPPLSASSHPIAHTRFPTPSTPAATSHGSRKHGRKQIGNGHPFTLRLTPSFGASPSAASGLFPRPFPLRLQRPSAPKMDSKV